MAVFASREYHTLRRRPEWMALDIVAQSLWQVNPTIEFVSKSSLLRLKPKRRAAGGTACGGAACGRSLHRGEGRAAGVRGAGPEPAAADAHERRIRCGPTCACNCLRKSYLFCC